MNCPIKKIIAVITCAVLGIQASQKPVCLTQEEKEYHELADQFLAEIHLDDIFEKILQSYVSYKPMGLRYLSTQTVQELYHYGDRRSLSESAAAYDKQYNRGVNVITQFIRDIMSNLRAELEKRKAPKKTDFQVVIAQKPLNLNGLTFKELQEMQSVVERILADTIEQERWAKELRMNPPAFIEHARQLKKMLTDDIEQINKRVDQALEKLAQEKNDERAKSAQTKDALQGKHAQESAQKLEEIAKKFPEFFNNIPAEIQLRFLNEFETMYAKNKSITAVLTDLYKDPARTKEQRLITLGTLLGFQSYYSYGYVFFDNGERARGVTLPQWLKVQRELKRAMEYEQVVKLEQESITMVHELVKTYKIHLMPLDVLDEVIIVLRLYELIQKDKDFSDALKTFKIIINPYRTNDTIYAKVVIYANGKENAQKILNTIYAKFKNTAGLGIAPRFNAKVTDLIWIAQGDGDYKVEPFVGYYELPGRVYYREDITGTIQNYHLINPMTGKEIN
jgi:hypothetical protein